MQALPQSLSERADVQQVVCACVLRAILGEAATMVCAQKFLGKPRQMTTLLSLGWRNHLH